MKRTKRSFIVGKKGFFLSGGFSKRHLSPYLTTGYKRGRVKLKTSIGRYGHKGSVSFRLAKRTSLNVERNFSHNKNRLYLQHKKRRIRFR